MSDDRSQQSPIRWPEEEREAESVADLLSKLEEESRGRTPAIQLGCVVGAALLLGVLSICTIPSLNGIWVLVGIAAAVAAILGLFRLTVTGAQQEIVVQLTRHGDIRIVPALVTALAWPDMERYRSTVAAALGKLLPRMKASDSALLSDRHRRILYRWLRGEDSELHIPILQALEQIGDERAIPVVERVAKARLFYFPRRLEIRAAAEACLVALRTRIASEGTTLLRPADSANDDRLLRAARGDDDSDPDTLLRSPDPEERVD